MINITKPTAIINPTICKSNISRMANKANSNNKTFRPHFKTHQSGAIGNWFKDVGVKSITVSSVIMAEYFSLYGWKNITIAFPTNILEIDKINTLAKKITLNLLIESMEVLHLLQKKIHNKVNFFIKIDAGYHRTGVDISDIKKISVLIDESKKSIKTNFIGFLIHNGHSYHANNKSDILNLYSNTRPHLKTLFQWKEKYHPKTILSFGDTPTLSVADDFNYIDEFRPGNFIFYDVMQLSIGSCSIEDIAVSVACPIVAKHKNRNEIITYGGGVHLSKESIKYQGQQSYGIPVIYNENGWTSIHGNVKSLSQEHGVITVDDDIFNKMNIGDVIGVLPIHSCLLPSLLGSYTDMKRNIFHCMANF